MYQLTYKIEFHSADLWRVVALFADGSIADVADYRTWVEALEHIYYK